jgi:hypothetical protein
VWIRKQVKKQGSAVDSVAKQERVCSMYDEHMITSEGVASASRGWFANFT